MARIFLSSAVSPTQLHELLPPLHRCTVSESRVGPARPPVLATPGRTNTPPDQATIYWERHVVLGPVRVLIRGEPELLLGSLAERLDQLYLLLLSAGAVELQLDRDFEARDFRCADIGCPLDVLRVALLCDHLRGRDPFRECCNPSMVQSVPTALNRCPGCGGPRPSRP